jgi:pyrroloquinoline-quinone synthase
VDERTTPLLERGPVRFHSYTGKLMDSGRCCRCGNFLVLPNVQLALFEGGRINRQHSRFLLAHPCLESRPMTQTLDLQISKWNLLEHPFYQAWSNGTLPVESLRTYAREYGAFIQTLPEGWDTLGESKAADVEVMHARLWDAFATALQTTVSARNEVNEVKALVETAKALFATPASAIGALYAFEKQQPATAASKLEGLDTHYKTLPEGVRPYFEAHLDDTHEAALLAKKMAGFTAEERKQCEEACTTMSKAMWDALSGVHAGTC